MALPVEGRSSSVELVAGRYEIEASLARGGMGEVFRARDRALDREVALKRLITGDDARRRTRMFEREFHTLAELKHPRIIEVYDYGIDARGAYYTMELLDGRDLRELAPLPWPEACRCLRDVASSLALLHARNLLHRDISPRNVRLTSDGRAKLLDFGALSSFGRQTMLVGTAPGIPPEAVHGEPLDQRADLYALGALGYWLLTGKHAFDVRTADRLPEAWKTAPAPPSELARAGHQTATMPAELDELILALLSRNPQARPVSAAEVIGRLVSLAKLDVDDEPLSALSYLHGSRTIGRARERAKLRRRVKAAVRGSGSLVAVEAETGMGGGRLLAELALEARLRGATAVVVDAGLHRGAYGTIEAIAQALFVAQPDLARAAMGAHAATLARFLPEGQGRTPSQRPNAGAPGRGDPRENRLRLQGALLAWLIEIAGKVPLLIAVHHADLADDSSAALLSSLAHGIEQRRMMLVFTHARESVQGGAGGLPHLKQSAERLQLRGLSREEVLALVEAIFGRVRHTERLAAALHQLSGGKPQGCLDVMRHLVEIGTIRFIQGSWALPQTLAPHELPADLGEALEQNLACLSPAALRLARALSVHRGPLPLERCLALARLEGIEQPLKLLPELQRRAVIVQGPDELRFTHARVRDALAEKLEPDERRRLHAHFGALIAGEDARDAETRLDAGWHLLHGGEELEGAKLLAELGVELSLDSDGIPAAVPALQAALEIYRKLRMTAREQAQVLGALTAAAFFTDRKLFERYKDETIAAMQDALGFSLARRLRGWLGVRLSGWVGLASGFLAYLFAYGPLRAPARYSRAVTLFTTIATSVVSHAVLTLDGPRARAGAALVEPLRALGKRHGVSWISDLLATLAQLPEDRIAQTCDAFARLVARVASPKPLPGISAEERTMLQVVTLYAWGALETFRESPEALRIADRLDQIGLKLAELFAAQIRANHYGLRGELALQQQYVQQVELFSLQAGSVWLAELWAPVSMLLCYNSAHDVAGLQRVIGELERVAADLPSLRLHLDLARASYHHTRGDFASAYAIGAPVVTKLPPRAFIGWAATMAGHIGAVRQLESAEKSREFALGVFSHLRDEDYSVTTMIMPPLVELALSELALGELESAARRVDDFLQKLPDSAGPLTRGNLHEVRARIAHAAGDQALAREQQLLMRRAFVSTENPVLIARAERLARELDPAGAAGGDARQAAGSTHTSIELARAQVERCASVAERHERVLSILLEHSAAHAGYLFTWDGSSLRWAAPLKLSAPAPGTDRCVRAEIERFAQSDSQATSVERGLIASEATDAYRVYLLVQRDGRGGDADKVVAAVALAKSFEPLRVPSRALLDALAAAISEPTSTSSQTRDWPLPPRG